MSNGLDPSILRFAVLIPAAGSGSRIGGDMPKQYVPVLGRPVLRHTVQVFAEMESCVEVIIPIDETWKEMAADAVAGLPYVRFVSGGGERQHSIRNGLDAIHSSPEIVLVHDAARPVVSPELIRRVVRAAAKHGGAVPALPITETVKSVDDRGAIIRTIPRAGLYRAQTPQGFRLNLLRRAYRHAEHTGFLGTDDASLVEEIGEKVVVVEGEEENIKITWKEDFARVEEILRRREKEDRGDIL